MYIVSVNPIWFLAGLLVETDKFILKKIQQGTQSSQNTL